MMRAYELMVIVDGDVEDGKAQSWAKFVTDEIADRFTVIGNVEQVTAKLKELESVGVDQFNIYLMTEGQNETLATYGKDILPAFQGVAA